MADRRRLKVLTLLLASLSLTLTGCSTRAAGGRWRLWAWIVVLALLALLVVLLVFAIVSWQRRIARVHYHLEIQNAGNVADRYALQAEAPGGGLTFLFTLRGMTLPGGSVSADGAETSPERDIAAAPVPRQSGSKRSQGKGVFGLASTISGLLITVGNLLPYNVGVHLIRIGSKMRRGQGSAERMGQISGQMSRATGSHAPAPERSIVQKRAATAAPDAAWAETPEVAPGETLTLVLQISPENPYRAQRLSYILRSRSLSQEEAKPIEVRHEVELMGLTPFQTYSPFLLLLMGVIGVVAAASLLIGG
ncbi:MAG: hypothetical protein ACP5HM_13575 [Anaerolineae bacterium]